ncbi:GNAT family N-acetyltransferase [uncultured Roseobacter sp.]|uniref:GNAT family N-acetyltransferase n=1 Tax=uncultured Roseobacter sp. TaxID=114847 RepID=UPI00261D181D|nr:GNAT family N-acetyltransferase [uncultured Roseobacter sp.]
MRPDFSAQAPDLAAFRALRRAAGLSVVGEEATRIALRNTLHGVWLWEGDQLVGMARLIGDGGSFAQVTDVAVHPRLQRQGWGHRIMARLMRWADDTLPSGCYISLIADPGAEALYERHGFALRTGMARRVP